MNPRDEYEKLYWKYVKILDQNLGIIVKRSIHEQAVKFCLISIEFAWKHSNSLLDEQLLIEMKNIANESL